MAGTRRIVICGGGAIGCAIALFASRRGAHCTVVERHAVAGAASGKSGGFLAFDWCRGTPLDRLARRSFQLHAELADTLGNPWGYRRLTTFAGHAHARNEGGGDGPLSWLSAGVALSGEIGSTDTTALVEPHSFTAGLLQAAGYHGAVLRPGTVVDLVRDDDGTVSGVRLEDGETVDGDAVVIAMGPWSILATLWLPLPAVYGFKGHSLVFRTAQPLPPEALFLEYRETGGELLTPEIFPRADGTTWACAVSSTASLPLDPAAVGPDAGAHARLETLCRSISPALAGAEIVRRQACFRPVTDDGLPLIGAVPGVPGAYVATGHSVWGMLNAPATGEAMAELMIDGRTSRVDLSPFAPGRLPAFDAARLRTASR
ncbi:NAD(P)/FAD-dependent oxidoreductase [Reyranella sp.]|uniref:NAD(P)/FAD-dependent oxidoreductase n=1 Tax=Reyranella sp. TaxID=1929291 RepID=UPI003BAD30C4